MIFGNQKIIAENSIVLELQALSTDSNTDIEDLLRKALLVARKLKLKDFRGWCESELNGYSCDFDNLPSYRKTVGTLYAKNPFHGKIPFIISDTELHDLVTRIPLYESISSYKNLVKKDPKSLQLKLSSEMINTLMSLQDGTNMMPILEANVNSIHNVMSEVRNKIYNWSLDLEEKGILGKGMKFSSVEKEVAQANNTTYNFNNSNLQGVIGTISDTAVHQNNQMNINQIDLETLKISLKSLGIGQEDISKLEKALSLDNKPIIKNEFGEEVQSWFGKMLTKSADGSWQVGIGVAANLLTSLLNSYYGF